MPGPCAGASLGAGVGVGGGAFGVADAVRVGVGVGEPALARDGSAMARAMPAVTITAVANAPATRNFNVRALRRGASLSLERILIDARSRVNGAELGCWRWAATLAGMQMIELRVLQLRPGARVPERATETATGFDLYACLDAPLTLTPAPQRVGTGIAIEFPAGYDVQVRPRSGLSAKGVGVALGTVDADYRGELLVTMWTFGGLDAYEVRDGDRIAQMVVAQLAPVRVVLAAELSATVRGDGGHGSTGR